MHKIDNNRVEYRIKIADGFENKFKDFIASHSDLISDCNLEDGIFIASFASQSTYEEFYKLASREMDIVYAKKDIDDDARSNWYAVNIPSRREIGIEQKFIEYSINNEGINEILLPKTESTVWKDQVKKTVKECMSPGYIFIKTTSPAYIMKAAADIDVRVSVLDHPVSEDEIEKLRIKEKEDCNFGQKQSYSVGDHICVCDGTFKGHNGYIEEIDEKNEGQLKVVLPVFGRGVSVKLGFSDIRKVNK
ncbi:hypothetical protein FZC35_00490 [Candidatus Cytomitobacter indipagum]|uniref:KOW domain-containing protein n=1 Tax=Candidatus Cytomitobacter indipagum TaxID=2601575 RepID=A0A5C0UFN7_9PROT|nr:transcription termination/antitermination NusG family protein [Candidatus Cytomitobacter indipagum]QEK37864.1 hypothetical protein FZC35_00490 [Candidatus Cytomitobacter indipagum]